MKIKKSILGFIILYASIAILIYVLRTRLNIDAKLLGDVVERFGILAPVIYSILLFLGLSVPLNPFSELILINIAAFSFPLPVAIAATFVGHSFAISINYFIGKKYGWKIIRKFSKTSVDRIERLVGKVDYKTVFFLRFILPINAIFGIDILSYLSGLTKLSFKRYYVVSIIPWTILNIIFFVSTKYFISSTQYLFFIPAVIIIVFPGVIYYLYQRSRV